MNEKLEVALIVLGVILIIFVLIFLLMLLFMPFFIAECNQLADVNPEYEFQFKFWAGCLVKVDGIWIDSDDMYYVIQKK